MTTLDNSKPRRQLGLFDATMIVMGGIVGAGIFANPPEVAHRVHTPFLILGVWMVDALLAMCGVLSGLNHHPFRRSWCGWRSPGDGPRSPSCMDGDCFWLQTGGMVASRDFASDFRALTGG
jgi:hypothetical protein